MPAPKPVLSNNRNQRYGPNTWSILPIPVSGASGPAHICVSCILLSNVLGRLAFVRQQT